MGLFCQKFIMPVAVMAMMAMVLGLLGVFAGPGEAWAETSRGAVEPAWEVLASPHENDPLTADRLAEIRTRAAQGQADAQHELGALLAVGPATKESRAEAAVWLERAARQGHSQAQFWLGNLYMHGHGVPKDFVRMIAWWRKAAVQGNLDAQYALGALYRDGGLVPRDLKRSRAWFFMASGQSGDVVNKNEARQVARRMLNRKPAEEEEVEAEMPVGFEDTGRNGR